jgi:hypothetical protein
MATIEQLREENALLEKNIQLLDAIKEKRVKLGVRSKVNDTFDGSQGENFTAHFTQYMQSRGKPFKGRSYTELMDAIASGVFRV